MAADAVAGQCEEGNCHVPHPTEPRRHHSDSTMIAVKCTFPPLLINRPFNMIISQQQLVETDAWLVNGGRTDYVGHWWQCAEIHSSAKDYTVRTNAPSVVVNDLQWRNTVVGGSSCRPQRPELAGICQRRPERERTRRFYDATKFREALTKELEDERYC